MLNVFHAYKAANGNADWCYNNYIHARSMKSAEDVRVQLDRIVERLAIKRTSTDFKSKVCLAVCLFVCLFVCLLVSLLLFVRIALHCIALHWFGLVWFALVFFALCLTFVILLLGGLSDCIVLFSCYFDMPVYFFLRCIVCSFRCNK
jgi:hypothetical protein